MEVYKRKWHDMLKKTNKISYDSLNKTHWLNLKWLHMVFSFAAITLKKHSILRSLFDVYTSSLIPCILHTPKKIYTIRSYSSKKNPNKNSFVFHINSEFRRLSKNSQQKISQSFYPLFFNRVSISSFHNSSKDKQMIKKGIWKTKINKQGKIYYEDIENGQRRWDKPSSDETVRIFNLEESKVNENELIQNFSSNNSLKNSIDSSKFRNLELFWTILSYGHTVTWIIIASAFVYIITNLINDFWL